MAFGIKSTTDVVVSADLKLNFYSQNTENEVIRFFAAKQSNEKFMRVVFYIFDPT